MLEQRKKWSKIAIGMFVLALVLPVVSRVLPKPAVETEAIVEQYLLVRTGFMVGMCVFAFLGLLIMYKYLRCPHCGAMALRKIEICGGCGKNYDDEVVEMSTEVETAEEPAASEAVVVSAAADAEQESGQA